MIPSRMRSVMIPEMQERDIGSILEFFGKWSLILNPIFIWSICLHGSEFYNTGGSIFMIFFYVFFYFFPVFCSCFIDSKYLFTMCELSFPPEGTLDRGVVHTRNQMSIEETCTEFYGFRFWWMSYVDKKKWHRNNWINYRFLWLRSSWDFIFSTSQWNLWFGVLPRVSWRSPSWEISPHW